MPRTERCQLVKFELTDRQESRLNLARTRSIRDELEGLGRFRPSLLLKFINPIGDRFHHIARCVASRVGLWLSLLNLFDLSFFDNSNCLFR